MSLPITIDPLGGGSWLTSWSGTAPFALVLRGRSLGTTSETTRGFDSDDAPALEVYETPDGETEPLVESQSLDYPPYVTLQWRGVLWADTYEIDVWDGAEWALQDVEIYENGAGYYTWESEEIDDGAEPLFRVYAVANGTRGEALRHTQEFMCAPAPPAVTVTGVNSELVIADA